MRNIFKPPSALTLAVRELEETERNLLRAEAAREHASALVEMYEERKARLEQRIREKAAGDDEAGKVAKWPVISDNKIVGCTFSKEVG